MVTGANAPLFKDHFSEVAFDYHRYRPRYPAALFRYLASVVLAHETAWDCGTGNGQAAVGLAPFFRLVIATDAGAEQIANAIPAPNVAYRTAPAERSGIDPGSIDLIMVAQALHWFDLEAFYAEARRVSNPWGIIAVWCYSLFRTASVVDGLIDRFYTEIVGPFWPPERKLIDKGYRSIEFPFPPILSPEFWMESRWDLARLLGYLRTWSSVQRYRERNGADPIDLIQGELMQAWGPPKSERRIQWPIHLRVGKIH